MPSTNCRRSRRKFTEEFKAEAVALVEASNGAIAKVAHELNIHKLTLGNWVHQAREETEDAPTAAERAKIRELKRVSRERDILGKAMAYFSTHDPRNG